MGIPSIVGAVAVLSATALSVSAAETVWVVEDRQPRAAIVLVNPDLAHVEQAATELREMIGKATSARLPLVSYDKLDEVPDGHQRIFVGWRPELAQWFALPDRIGPETSIRIVNPHGILLAGDDSIGLRGDAPASPKYLRLDPIGSGSSDWISGKVAPSPSTLWAAYGFLEDIVGVRWLWPGEVGTYIPEHDSLGAAHGEVVRQPEIEQRRLRMLISLRPEPSRRLLSDEEYRRVMLEAEAWSTRHRMGSRGTMQFGHAFTKWWPRYHAEHPDYFAVPLEGFEQPFPNDRRVKLNVSNPQVVDQIVKEWIAAGRPASWNVSPNDGSGFCVCDDCLAMDDPPNQSPEVVWRAQGDLSARYVKFWNEILRAMRKHRPDVKITTYAYSAYRELPPNLELEPGMVIQVVDAFEHTAKRRWTEWADAGAELMLRPNWWHTGAVAPLLPLGAVGEYFSFVREHGMIGFDFDSILGNWSTQGLNYYLIARMSQDPALTTEDIIGEYTQAFGSAAPLIREYIRYWEAFTRAAAYTIPAGGIVAQDLDGRYEQLMRQHGLEARYPLVGGWEVIPYLYTDDALAPARDLLRRAHAVTAQDAPVVRARIAFLQAGLDHLVLTRDLLALAMNTRRTPREQAMLRETLAELQSRRHELTRQHVVWGEVLNWVEDRYRIPTVPKRARGGVKENLDGM